MKRILCSLLVATLPFGSALADPKSKKPRPLTYQHELTYCGMNRINSRGLFPIPQHSGESPFPRKMETFAMNPVSPNLRRQLSRKRSSTAQHRVLLLL
jgi:hypothetical protein